MSLAFNLIISSVGFVYFIYGKKIAEFRFLIAGLLLMIYPYFIQSIVPMAIMGVLFAVAPFVLRDLL